MTGDSADGITRAVSAFLLDRAHLLLPLAAQLGDTQFESAVHGSSMAPAIPAGARIRVRTGGTCRVGDVVFYLADGVYTVHRVVYRSSGRGGTDYLLAEGDARFAPDPPLRPHQVLGTVEAVEVGGVWRPLGAQPVGPWHRRLVRALTLPAMRVTMRASVAASARLAALLLALESRARVVRRRVLHSGDGARAAPRG